MRPGGTRRLSGPGREVLDQLVQLSVSLGFQAAAVTLSELVGVEAPLDMLVPEGLRYGVPVGVRSSEVAVLRGVPRVPVLVFALAVHFLLRPFRSSCARSAGLGFAALAVFVSQPSPCYNTLKTT